MVKKRKTICREQGRTVFVGMSGGVDSSVAAALLKKAGFDVVGVYMKCWVDGASCTTEDDERSARVAADHLGIPFYTWNFLAEYREKVVEYMLAGYRQGITPNPDMMCNKEIKFGLFFEKAMRLGADFVATGHYARIRRYPFQRIGGSPIPAIGDRLLSRRENFHFVKNQASRASEGFSGKDIGFFALMKGIDENKDQSYFLSFIKPEVLSRVLFPVGEFTKPKIREYAEKIGLPNAKRKDSQGICFVGKVEVGDFLRKYIKNEEGDIVDEHGKVLGKHDGAWFYTIGQRDGLGLSGGPYYVTGKDMEKNIVMVAREEDGIMQNEIFVKNMNWFKKPLENLFEAQAKFRYRQEDVPVLVVVQGDGSVKITAKTPQRAITPGQFAVLYDNDRVLGGGIIV